MTSTTKQVFSKPNNVEPEIKEEKTEEKNDGYVDSTSESEELELNELDDLEYIFRKYIDTIKNGKPNNSIRKQLILLMDCINIKLLTENNESNKKELSDDEVREILSKYPPEEEEKIEDLEPLVLSSRITELELQNLNLNKTIDNFYYVKDRNDVLISNYKRIYEIKMRLDYKVDIPIPPKDREVHLGGHSKKKSD